MDDIDCANPVKLNASLCAVPNVHASFTRAGLDCLADRQSFGDACCRQEVLGGLLAHAGGGSGEEVDASLDALVRQDLIQIFNTR